VYLKKLFDGGWISGKEYYTDVNNATTPDEYWDNLQRLEDRCIDDALAEIKALVIDYYENVDIDIDSVLEANNYYLEPEVEVVSVTFVDVDKENVDR